MCSCEFISVSRYFLVFLKVCWPSFSKGIDSVFLVCVIVCCGAVCDVDSELPGYMCESSRCSLTSGREG